MVVPPELVVPPLALDVPPEPLAAPELEAIVPPEPVVPPGDLAPPEPDDPPVDTPGPFACEQPSHGNEQTNPSITAGTEPKALVNSIDAPPRGIDFETVQPVSGRWKSRGLERQNSAHGTARAAHLRSRMLQSQHVAARRAPSPHVGSGASPPVARAEAAL